ncbi:MAG: nuclear transport factor 2 family protein [Candidatus Binatia bacterium]
MTTPEALDRQEEIFRQAFEAGDIRIARDLYHSEVVYRSPTVRLFGWPLEIEGVEKTLEFIAVTVRDCRHVRYRAVERAIGPAGAFVRIHFDWALGDRRVRSNYVVIYRYRQERITRQELYYDPGGELEDLGPA